MDCRQGGILRSYEKIGSSWCGPGHLGRGSVSSVGAQLLDAGEIGICLPIYVFWPDFFELPALPACLRSVSQGPTRLRCCMFF